MRIRTGLLILAFAGGTASFASAQDCSTHITPETAAALLAQEKAGAYALNDKDRVRTEYLLQVPITFHIVRRTDGTGGISTTDVASTLDSANVWWAATGIRFFQSGAFDYISSDSLYLGVDTDAEFGTLWSTNAVPNTINVYFIGAMPGCGRSSFSPDAVQGIAVRNDCTMQASYPTSLAHELGHYFDLYHTHETVFGVECPDESNCSTAGDKVCDTPADPDVSKMGFLFACTYVGTAMACGNQAYFPDPTNLMSYGAACRNHFTQGQRDRALATLINVRSSLIQAPGLNVTWVDFNFAFPFHTGSYTLPFDNLASAEAATNVGGTVVIKTGSTRTGYTFTKALHWDSFRGVARIGP